MSLRFGVALMPSRPKLARLHIHKTFYQIFSQDFRNSIYVTFISRFLSRLKLLLFDYIPKQFCFRLSVIVDSFVFEVYFSTSRFGIRDSIKEKYVVTFIRLPITMNSIQRFNK